MSVLAFKALSHGAEAIPDKFFEKIPGGFFTPAEKKKIQKGRDRRSRERAERHKSEERGSKRSSRRARSPESEYTDSEYDDTDDERARNRRKKDRSRRAKSVGRSSSRSLSRGRQDRRNSRDDRDMAHAGQGEPYFPPPPASDYRPYNPQDYASTPAQADYRPASVSQPYGYPAQVNNFSHFRSATVPTVPTMAAFSTPVNSPGTVPPMLMRRPSSNQPTFFPAQPTPLNLLSRGTPISASFSPSTEPPLAALFSRPLTNTPKPAAAYPPPAGQHSPTFTNPNYAAGQRHGSVAAAKYAPGPGYAPSPVMPHASTVPPPVVAASPYPTYNPAEYSAKARDNAPPPFNRQRSNSQPSYAPYTTYIPPSEDQRLTAYDANNQPPSSRRDSTKPRREHRHRARSADTHSSSRRDRDDRRRSNSRMTKVRERFDEQFDRMDMREKGLAATVGGALAGGLAGRQLGHSKLTTLAGVAAGAFGGRTFMEQKQRSK